jgi:hypothetical protein
MRMPLNSSSSSTSIDRIPMTTGSMGNRACVWMG